MSKNNNNNNRVTDLPQEHQNHLIRRFGELNTISLGPTRTNSLVSRANSTDNFFYKNGSLNTPFLSRTNSTHDSSNNYSGNSDLQSSITSDINDASEKEKKKGKRKGCFGCVTMGGRKEKKSKRKRIVKKSKTKRKR